MVENAYQAIGASVLQGGLVLLVPLISMNAEKRARGAMNAVTSVETYLVLMNVSVRKGIHYHPMDVHAKINKIIVSLHARITLAVFKVVVFAISAGKAIRVQMMWMSVQRIDIHVNNCVSILTEATVASVGKDIFDIPDDRKSASGIHKCVYQIVRMVERAREANVGVPLAGLEGHAKRISTNAAIATIGRPVKIEDATISVSTPLAVTRVSAEKVTG